MKLGIIDWGIGGVSLLKRIHSLSLVDMVYFSDTGYTPYGKVSTEELRARLSLVIDFLRSKDCRVIAVACNAASTVLPTDKNILGVIHPAMELVKEMKLEKLGIVGGRRTIESEIYKKGLEEVGMIIHQEIAQPLSARIEKGDLNSDELKKEIEEIFTPLKDEKNILLACTHYPVIAQQINDFLPNAHLIDPISRMSEQVIEALGDAGGKQRISWITSGNIHEMSQSIQKVYGIEAKSIEKRML